jgi:hypothetical protein
MTEATNIEENQSTLGELVRHLELKPSEDRLFIGRRRGFPVGLKFITSPESILLLFQIRHPFDAKAAKQLPIEYDAEVKDLVSSNKIEISLEDKIVWLTITDAGQMIGSNQAARIIESLLGTFEKAGLAGDPQKCHYCRASKVETLTCHNGKVAQICDECLAGRKKSQYAHLALSAEGFTKVISLGIVASVVGAVCWMLAWMGDDAIFKFFKTDTLVIPHILEAAMIVVIGFLVGGPVGLILRRIPQRGDRLAGYAGITFGIASVIVGEVFYVSWLIYSEYKVIAPGAAFQILPSLWLHGGVVYITIKALAAVAGVLFAYHLSRPQQAGLKL